MPDHRLVTVRPALAEDGPRILSMMGSLAAFEGYADDFAVTLEALEQRLFIQRDFSVLVADVNGSAVGMLVYYSLPFSYDLTPWLYMKELFVEPHLRNLGVGKKLLASLARECQNAGGRKIRWDVLASNEPAARFYKAQGAVDNEHWRLFSLDAAAIANLANSS
ncbi:GNAT family N-acetyltransferase [Simiduia litorea]|uniref:GNAT family N-acetyltransferase n=1 Tax=Simiduia litorea TaxID=1435348 RepID=UPI0036F3F271